MFKMMTHPWTKRRRNKRKLCLEILFEDTEIWTSHPIKRIPRLNKHIMLPQVVDNGVLKCYVLVTRNCSSCKLQLGVCLEPARAC